MAFPFITTLVLCAAQGVVLDRPPGLVVVGIAAADDADGDGGDAMDLDLGDMFELADAADADDEAAADEAA